jgi:DNA-directed RNA polymerase specialized sigma24 family protein
MHSVTEWLAELKEGSESAAQRIYERFVGRLQALARRKLSSRTRKVVDEEDVVQATMRSAFSAIARGRFPRLDDRNDLWQVLAMLVDRKVVDAMRREGRRPCEELGVVQVHDPRPTPEYAALFADELRCRLEQLGDETLQTIVILKLQGFSNQEAASAIACTERTVERKLRLIREIWRPPAKRM